MDVEAGPGLTQPVPARVVELLRGTRPWVRLLSIVGFVTVGLMVVFALIMAVASPWMDQGPVFGVVAGIFYIALAIVYFFPCLFLLRYASSIDRLVRGGGQPAMEEALDHQRRFWRVVGILTIVMLCLYALILAVGVGAMVLFGLRG